MNQFTDPNTETTDLEPASVEERVLRRFAAALDQSRHGGPVPDVKEYLDAVPESARPWLREELESLTKGSPSQAGTMPESRGGETRPGSVPVDEPTLSYVRPALPSVSQSDGAEPIGTVDYVSSNDPAFSITPQVGAAGSLDQTEASGTTDYKPSAPDDTQHLSARTKRIRGKTVPVPESVAGYEILGVLGRGAMGVVYKARQPGLNRLVALKMILAGDHASERDLARFRSEAEAVAHLQHPNIVQIYEVGDDAGRPFFSLEFVDGYSLSNKIDSTPQPPREAARMVQLLAIAMSAAHQRGIVHRDLKPTNVLMTADGTPKITDFGLAKRLEEDSGQTRSGMVIGTPSYMAPEQAEGRTHDIGPISDVYSLGATLYEMLTGRAPFKGGSVLDTLQMVRTQEPVAPVEFSPSVPRDLETICLKCLQKDPARRYASAAALADDLGRFLHGRPILARPVSLPERSWRWAKRNPRVAVLSVVIALALLAWGVTASLLSVSLKQQKDKTEEARIQSDANAARAEKNAETAKNRHQLAVHRMIELGEQLQIRVSARRFGPDASPALRGVRDDLLRLLRESMAKMGKDIEGAGVTGFGMVRSYQELGDLLRKIGLGDEALAQYQQGFDLAKQIAADKPVSDLAQANKGVMLRRLGDMALELNGNVQTARKNYQEAYDIQKAILDNPKSSDYTETDNRRILWQILFELGKIELACGDLPAARRAFEEALASSRHWLDLVQGGDTLAAESSLAGDYLWLGVVAHRAGDVEAAKRNFAESLHTCSAVATRDPDYFGHKADLAEIFAFQGDAQVRSGQLDEAAASYLKLRENLMAVLNHDPEDMSRQPMVARTHERVAALALEQNKPEEAAKRFQEALKIWDELKRLEPTNMSWQAAHAVALARAGKFAEAAKAADEVSRRCPNAPELLLQTARSHAIRAAAVGDAEKDKAVERALACLQQAVDAGWKDARLLESDPELASIRAHRDYAALLAKLPKPSS
jgi:serine/threonine-protein kinase